MGDSRSSSEDPTSEKEWVLYRDRTDWKDVTPIPQNDGPSPVVQIAYSDRFKDVYDYFRAVMKSEEKSSRVLGLTEDALDLNPANYTVWYYRREVLKSLKSNLKDELAYCREMIEEHPKNYQVWQHRRVLIEWLQDPGNELRFTEVILAADQKNYHAWQHRQWVLQAFSLWKDELEFVERLLDDDIRNNSAWNERFYVVSQSEGWKNPVVEREIKFVLEKINMVSRNESAWNYLRGVLEHCEDDELRGELRSRVQNTCQQLLDKGDESPYLLGFMVELLIQDLENKNLKVSEQTETLKKIESMCTNLATNCDKIRKKYWDYILATVQSKYKSS
ncbi:protein farnesyltransferase/geranylgeranyltransferase type-1 subunit alpha [Eurytemora carolleeae]|uniref:protein farnesyltransferase/geranylgeranyltransferase type-1 subunit alpha n=1 Tax=Eurytemora carolleeae TaxID=1294199 RepID=UPI000C77A00E|nr:protein farnesyltransferase/geranylgeranyltransferase type-1 subunit alpha [Eurytemora carolleeae]|eukprot:XP_023322155.1 protein farnesyltransferase/geranylgeranyltransferase type-1 subunit alpha-like [Eurytemora affinis]